MSNSERRIEAGKLAQRLVGRVQNHLIGQLGQESSFVNEKKEEAKRAIDNGDTVSLIQLAHTLEKSNEFPNELVKWAKQLPELLREYGLSNVLIDDVPLGFFNEITATIESVRSDSERRSPSGVAKKESGRGRGYLPGARAIALLGLVKKDQAGGFLHQNLDDIAVEMLLPGEKNDSKGRKLARGWAGVARFEEVAHIRKSNVGTIGEYYQDEYEKVIRRSKKPREGDHKYEEYITYVIENYGQMKKEDFVGQVLKRDLEKTSLGVKS